MITYVIRQQIRVLLALWVCATYELNLVSFCISVEHVGHNPLFINVSNNNQRLLYLDFY